MSIRLTARRTLARAALPMLLAISCADGARAQTAPDVDSLRRDLQEMKSAYETRLRDLEQRLGAAEKTAAAPPPAPPPMAAAPVASASAFNPGVAVVLDGRFASFARDPAAYRLPGFMRGDNANPGERGFALGESEISLFSNVDQDLYGNLTVSFTRDAQVNIEEAFLQTTSLPAGFTLKAGRFFSGIGYLNEQHAHTWDFADAPLPYLAFLNGQFGDDGVQARWLAPTNYFLEFGGEAARGDAFPAGGAANRGVGAFSGFGHVGADLNESSSVRTGLSYLRTKAANRDASGDIFNGTGQTGIVDFVYKWAPGGDAVDTNFKLQGEYFHHREYGLFNDAGYSGQQSGWYAQAVYQFMPRWRVGVRHDRLYAAAVDPALTGTTVDSLGMTPRRYSAMTDYSTSEFGRFRLQYSRDRSGPDTDHQVLLQYTLSLGAHPAHSY